VIVLLLVAGGALLWKSYQPTVSPPVEVAPEKKMAFPLPDKPSLAVLPFDNLGGDSSQDYFSDGITESIITALSNVANLFVIARNSSFTYKGKPVKVQRVAEELGVRYVLEGSVQRSGDRVRITAQLVDALKGHHLWAENYDRKFADIFALQDDITDQVAMALQVKLTEGEQARIRRGNMSNPEAYEHFLRGLETFRSFTKENNAEARKFWEKAAELDPNYAHVWQSIGWTYYRDGRFGWTDTPNQSLDRAEELAQKTLAMDDSDAFAYGLLSVVYMARGKHDKAVAYAEKALSLAPNFADMTATMALPYLYSGKPEVALELVKNAMRHSPYYPAWYLGILGIAYRLTGQYEEAIAWLEKWRDRANPRSALPPLFLAYTYEEAGRGEEAQVAVAELLKRKPKASIEGYRNSKVFPYKDPVEVERILEALRRAGLPEKPPLSLPDKPSIAVLPFENMSDDPKQEYFADGLTDDLITDLSKISGLFVIARNSTFTYKGKPVKVQKVAEDLGVRYVLEGSVRKAGDKVRINAQLVDATTGHHLWAERFDSTLGDIFALQDRFTRKIVAALAVKLTAGEQELVTQRGTQNVQAYDAYLQGWEYLERATREDLVEAVNYFKKAIELDSNYSRAHAALARAYGFSMERGFDHDLGWTDASSLRDKHLQMAMKNPTPYTYRAVAKSRLYQRKYEEAIAAAERALVLAPNDTDSLFSMARVLIYSGRPAEGLEYLQKAIRLNPHYPAYYLWWVGLAQFSLEHYEEAVTSYERLLERSPKSSVMILAASHAYLSRQQEAADVFTKYLHMRGNTGPGVPAENFLKYYPFKDSKDADRFVDGLLKAGLPRPWNPVYRGHYDEALTRAEQAVRLNPNDAEAQFTLGETLIYAGRPSKAVESIKKAMELDPKYPPYYLWYLGLAQFCLEQYQEALTTLEEYYTRKIKPARAVPKWLLAATQAQLGHQQEAQETLSKLMKKRVYYRGYSVEKVLRDNYYAFKNPENKDRLAEALHKAGLPMKSEE
jgi:TolB-like protein/Tfp pilus assembly protein PilF